MAAVRNAAGESNRATATMAVLTIHTGDTGGVRSGGSASRYVRPSVEA